MNSVFRGLVNIIRSALTAAITGLILASLTACAPQDPRYGPLSDGGHRLPPIPSSKLDSSYLRQSVSYSSDHKAGTVVVNTKERFLYLVQGNGKAIRYGIAVGAEGMAWRGTATVAQKRHWPRWTPPADMIRRDPHLAQYSRGIEPSVANPLGARALYLSNGKGDTGYRIHGTPEWTSIGRAKSSGCIRLINQDVIDLYDRVPMGATVVVL